MKKFIYSFGIAAMLLFASCKKDTPTNNSTPVATGTPGEISFKVNDSTWKSKGLGRAVAFFQDSNNLMIVGSNIVGSDTSGIVLSLVLTPSELGVYQGTFNLSSSTYGLYYPNTKQSTQMSLILGYAITYKISLTKLDRVNKLVSGTFTITETAPTGSGYPNYNITDGVFTDMPLVQ